jgi:hypothetical protein
MFRGVLVLGGIAAAHVTAAQAQPQVHPGIAHLQALFASTTTRFHVLHLIQMFAPCHVLAPLSRPGEANILPQNLPCNQPFCSWVVGDEPYVSLHLLGAADYAKRKGG